MADPTYWKGYLKLSLVTCPVSLTPATTDRDKVRFHTLNRATGHRVASQYVDSETGKAVADDDEGKGYETADGKFVILEDEDLESVALESTRTIDIDCFVPKNSISWIWYDTPYYLAPSDKVGEEAFSVIRQAMATTDVVGISRLVLFRRERAVMLAPRDNGIVLWTLRYGDEVRDPEAYFADIKAPKAEAKLANLVKSLIEERMKEWDPSMVKDPVQENLLKIIEIEKEQEEAARQKGPHARAKIERDRFDGRAQKEPGKQKGKGEIALACFFQLFATVRTFCRCRLSSRLRGRRFLGATSTFPQRIQQADDFAFLFRLDPGERLTGQFRTHHLGYGIFVTVVKVLGVEFAGLGFDDVLGEIDHLF